MNQTFPKGGYTVVPAELDAAGEARAAWLSTGCVADAYAHPTQLRGVVLSSLTLLLDLFRQGWLAGSRRGREEMHGITGDLVRTYRAVKDGHEPRPMSYPRRRRVISDGEDLILDNAIEMLLACGGGDVTRCRGAAARLTESIDFFILSKLPQAPGVSRTDELAEASVALHDRHLCLLHDVIHSRQREVRRGHWAVGPEASAVLRSLARTRWGVPVEIEAFDMSVLADALEDGGFADREALAHCRNGRPHADSCWVLDRLDCVMDGRPR